MSLTKDRLKQIIKEELTALLNEEVKSAKETLEDLGFRVDGDFEEGELEDADRKKDIDFLKLKDGRFRMTVREEASDGGYDVSTHDHDSLDGLVQHIQQELGEGDLMEGDMGELKKRAEAAYDKYVEKEFGFTKNMSKDDYVKNYLSIANEMGLDKALGKHRLIAREATFTRIEDPVKMSDFLLGKNNELKKNAEAGYDKYMKKGWKMPDKDEYVKNYLAIANKMANEQGLDKALKAHGFIAREATFTRIDDPVKMSDFLLGKKQ